MTEGDDKAFRIVLRDGRVLTWRTEMVTCRKYESDLEKTISSRYRKLWFIAESEESLKNRQKKQISRDEAFGLMRGGRT